MECLAFGGVPGRDLRAVSSSASHLRSLRSRSAVLPDLWPGATARFAASSCRCVPHQAASASATSGPSGPVPRAEGQVWRVESDASLDDRSIGQLEASDRAGAHRQQEGIGWTFFWRRRPLFGVLCGSPRLGPRSRPASAPSLDTCAPQSARTVARRLRRYVTPNLLCVDEVGYLSYDTRYADLLFEVVTRRYDAQKPILLSTNKPFSQWTEVFPHARASSHSSIVSSIAPR
jgi:hypothetical protein